MSVRVYISAICAVLNPPTADQTSIVVLQGMKITRISDMDSQRREVKHQAIDPKVGQDIKGVIIDIETAIPLGRPGLWNVR